MDGDNSPDSGQRSGGDPAEPDPVMVVMTFDTDQPGPLSDVLAHYVVLSRTRAGCRNIDLVTSTTRPGRLMVVEKWHSAGAQRTHFDSPEMVEMARACDGLLSRPPDIDLLEGISMHDLA